MFEFAWPWIPALAPLPWLLRRLLPAKQSEEAALNVSFLAELEEQSGLKAHSEQLSLTRQLPFILIWLLLLLAAARPQWLGEPLPVASNGRDLLLAVDVSGSMNQSDMQWQDQSISRLDAVKHLFGEFLEKRQGDRVGLILFGSEPYLQSPLTFDRRTVRTWLNEAEVGIAGAQTALGDAIGLAIKQLLVRPANSRMLILITDGANNGGVLSPRLAADLAAKQQVRIYTIGIGATQRASSGIGLQGAVDLDESTLAAIANSTDGQYFRAQDAQALNAIQRTLDTLEPVSQAAQLSHSYRELYPWPLATALLLSMLLAAKTPLKSCWLKFRERTSR